MIVRVLALMVCSVLLVLGPAPSPCLAGSVKVQVSGVQEKLLQNVRATTELPAGLVKNGEVNTLLLDRFVDDMPDLVQEGPQALRLLPSARRNPARSQG